jgi:hypothetical protein
MEDHAGKVFEAMGHGALDAINTPMMGTVKVPRKAGMRCSKKFPLLKD